MLMKNQKIYKIFIFVKMSKELVMSCDFPTKQLLCELPTNTMDVVLKICMRLGEHTFWEDLNSRMMKYQRWCDTTKSFRGLKRSIASMYRKSDSESNSQKSKNILPFTPLSSDIGGRTVSSEESSIHDCYGFHSDWSSPGTTSQMNNMNLSEPQPSTSDNTAPTYKTVKSIILAPYYN